ncbi:MAG TPA: hypothetical protein VK277_07380 [Acidimicrobiales bacterium]|nr:hypothetical protein [Acidimicrobiales bacterium]
MQSSIIVPDVLPAPPEVESPAPPEVVIREARRRQRRRWFLVTAVVVVIVVAAVVTWSVVTGERAHPPASGPPPRHLPTAAAQALPSTPPERPQALAVGPTGALYVADGLRDQILERHPDGRFTVVAGNGTIGFSGDGGPAIGAEIDRPGGMVVAPDGTLYFADMGNGRVRAVSPAGTITTVAGDGQIGRVADGTPAGVASLNPSAVTIGPGGTLYVASDPQILRLGTSGTFTCVVGCTNGPYDGLIGVGGPAVDGSADGPTGLAFDKAGDLFFFGFNTKTMFMVDPEGVLHVIGSAYPRFPGGLVTAPDGTVIAMDELGILRLSPGGLETVLRFPGGYRVKATFHGVSAFSPDGIAIASDGSIYVDTFGDGFSNRSAIAVIRPDGTSSLLWNGPVR